jgi:formamidopyrimidine-DNA glycosylase
MPELPEVETIVRGLRKSVPGRRITTVRLGKTDFIEKPEELARRLPGCRIEAVARCGKFIELHCRPAGDGASEFVLFIHLGMTGWLAPQQADAPTLPHTHLILALDDGRELRYRDTRRFGRIFLLSAPEAAEFREHLGAEPLEISAGEFVRLVGRRRAMIKALLLGQRVLRGLGNIYVDESLWRARIHPRRLASRLSPEQLRRLHAALQRILRRAIALRGSSIADYRDAEGNRGAFQLQHRIYGREGQRCLRCGATVRRIVVAGRGTHVCLRCQPPPKRRRVLKSRGRR